MVLTGVNQMKDSSTCARVANGDPRLHGAFGADVPRAARLALAPGQGARGRHHEIEITRVVDGYLAYIKDLREIDIELAADFLLMAATLMSIKSRSLLPREEIDLEAELDPRDELIQRLIEYRHFKTASRDLGERFDARSRIFAHGWHPPTAEEPTLDSRSCRTGTCSAPSRA